MLAMSLLALPLLGGCAIDAEASIAEPPIVTNQECAGPDGPSQKYAASEDAYVDLAGVWDRCASTLTNIPSDVAGVEFDGKYAYFLVQGPRGLVRGTGTAYTRTVQLRVDGQGVVLMLADSDGTFAAYSAEITASPHRLRIENTTTHAYLTLGAR
ncbi:hypothetical protein BH09MYX1_BH09MYX1_42090 [soil metagenome]